ncbi:MAG: chemotaxis-specific protein-glutamate methyltransferase CheB [Myxococcales bacterium]|nr:chemotaxis-specific protein-glutamate methyltransferase CheB [Myxococcales bacterium]MCB9736811.1 chemotaxis-specific protein-glutamate methyltransferase CheB [Deltaproteobacteria bacterium]
MTNGRLRVLVAEDSATVRARLVEVLRADAGIEVVGEARDGREAVALCSALRPDVLTVDMMMPIMTGLAATEHIMAYCPTPILVVSSSINRAELFETYEALAAGAVDVLEKPTGEEPVGEWETRFLAAVRMVARIKVITHPRARLRDVGGPPPTAPFPRPGASPRAAIAIGASTGGPGAVLEVLRGLGPDFPLPILLVIHIGAPFGAAFADWLDGLSPLRVRTPVEGEALPPRGRGVVFLAPPEQHLVLRGGRLGLTDAPPRHSCRPSVDVLFESVAGELGASAVGCLLTGMGNDGAAGLLAMRAAGATTIAQDEATSAVYGMPREAARIGAASRILALEAIPPALARLAASSTSEVA